MSHPKLAIEMIGPLQTLAMKHSNLFTPLSPALVSSGEPESVPPSGILVEAEELILSPPNAGHTGENSAIGSATTSYRDTGLRLRPISRPKGMNDCGMVAWLMTLRTPECPQVWIKDPGCGCCQIQMKYMAALTSPRPLCSIANN